MRVWLLVVFMFGAVFAAPVTAKAAGLSLFATIRERIEYFFAFATDTKAQVLEKQAVKRLNMAKEYAQDGDNQGLSNVLENYVQLKDKQNNLIGGLDKNNILGGIEEQTIEQQKTMEEIKTITNEEGKKNVQAVQEKVVKQVAQKIVEVNGPEGQTEFFEKVEHVWAPGTGPGEGGTTFAPGTTGTGNGGVVVVGGSIQFAPGTSAGGTSGVVIEGGSGQYAPGTSAGGPSGSDIKTVEIKAVGGN